MSGPAYDVLAAGRWSHWHIQPALDNDAGGFNANKNPDLSTGVVEFALIGR